MLHKLLLTCGGFLLVLLSAFSLTDHQPRAGFTYVNPSDIHTLDPARMSWLQDFRVALNLWEGLTMWHPQTMEPMGAAALFPPDLSTDGLIYTFTLRDDGRWSNGDVVTAADFVRGWRRSMEPGTAADYAFFFADHIQGAADYMAWRQQALTALTQGADADAVQVFQTHASEFEERFGKVGITAIDERTLQVILSHPCPYFLDLTAMPVFLPCHASIELLREGHGAAPFTKSGLVVYDSQWTKPNYHRNGYSGLVTNGPYRLVDWKFKRRAWMEVNAFHRAASSVACRTIEMLVYDNLNAALTAYESGYVDFLPELGVTYDHELARLSLSGQRPDFKLCPVSATYFLNFNCASESALNRRNPMLDQRIRRALSLAVDREQIVRNVRARGDRVARSFIPPDAVRGYAPPRGLDLDRVEARRLLAEAGFPGGAGLPPIDLLYTQNDERVIQALARMWELELGVRVDLRCKESKTFGEDKSERRYMIARGKWYADYNDPTTFLDCLTTGNGNNDSGYSNPAYDALLQQADRTIDRDARVALLSQAEAIIVEQDVPILPLFHFTEPVAIQPYVQGLYPNPRLWFSFQHVRVQR